MTLNLQAPFSYDVTTFISILSPLLQLQLNELSSISNGYTIKGGNINANGNSNESGNITGSGNIIVCGFYKNQ